METFVKVVRIVNFIFAGTMIGFGITFLFWPDGQYVLSGILELAMGIGVSGVNLFEIVKHPL